jgi:hypothetical protein
MVMESKSIMAIDRKYYTGIVQEVMNKQSL